MTVVTVDEPRSVQSFVTQLCRLNAAPADFLGPLVALLTLAINIFYKRSGCVAALHYQRGLSDP